MAGGNELGPTADATTVRVRGDETLVTDGPYAEVKEALGGYFLFECESMDADEPEVLGLLALMLLQDSRRAARVGADGKLVLLEDQDRSLWDRHRIDEGMRMLQRAVSLRRPGPYQLQAAIAAAHTEARPWTEIVLLYDRLAEIDSSPVVRLSRAVTVALSGRVDEGLALLDDIEGLDGYHLLHAARADLYRRLDRRDEAAVSYRRALELTANEPETRYLERRLAEVS